MKQAEVERIFAQKQFQRAIVDLNQLVTEYFKNPEHEAAFRQWKEKRDAAAEDRKGA